MAHAYLKWSDFKAECVARQMAMQWREIKNVYWIKAVDGPFGYECIVRITDPVNEDQVDFETNFKNATTSNKKIEPPKDTDGNTLNRIKTTIQGWHYQPHAVEFETSVLSSVYNKDLAGNDLGFSTIKLYDSSGVEITDQGVADTDCVKTVVDWMPTYDYEIIGAKYYHASAPTGDLRLWVVGVPDTPKAYGGSVEFAQGGINLKYTQSGNGLDTDGRSSKFLTYNAVNKTNKFRLVFKHDAGFKHKAMIVWEIYKAP